MRRNRTAEFAGLAVLKQEHARQIEMFEQWAAADQWPKFHHSHYDWWAFPIDQPSSFGFRYTVYAGDIAELMADADFASGHVRGIELVAASWGWDVRAAGRLPRPHPRQEWTGCAIRLYKAALSAKLFHRADLFDSLAVFARGLLDSGESLSYNGEDLAPLFKRRR